MCMARLGILKEVCIRCYIKVTSKQLPEAGAIRTVYKFNTV